MPALGTFFEGTILYFVAISLVNEHCGLTVVRLSGPIKPFVPSLFKGRVIISKFVYMIMICILAEWCAHFG